MMKWYELQIVVKLKNNLEAKTARPLRMVDWQTYDYVLKMLINYEKLQKRSLILDNLLRLPK